MELAISNIAWTKEEEPAVAQRLGQLGVKCIELAPTKQWQDPTSVDGAEIKKYASFWTDQGFEIVALQSMLFNRPDLKIFESAKKRQETLDYLSKFIDVARELGAKIMVFGSPKNRQKDTLTDHEATAIATDFFGELHEVAASRDVYFCLEPNPPDYDCDFVTTAKEGVSFLKILNKSSIRLHLDLAAMTLNGENIAESIELAAPYLKHFHISAPYLQQIEARPDVAYGQAAQALRAIGYSGLVSIEMRPGTSGQNLERVDKAVKFAQGVFAPTSS